MKPASAKPFSGCLRIIAPHLALLSPMRPRRIRRRACRIRTRRPPAGVQLRHAAKPARLPPHLCRRPAGRSAAARARARTPARLDDAKTRSGAGAAGRVRAQTAGARRHQRPRPASVARRAARGQSRADRRCRHRKRRHAQHQRAHRQTVGRTLSAD